MKLCAWFKKQLFGNELDELQQQKADQIGHRGFWLAWALLLIALLIQSIAGADMTQMAAEWSIFMILCIYGLIEWIRNQAHPAQKRNLVGRGGHRIFYLSSGSQQPPELVGTRRLVGRGDRRRVHRLALPRRFAARRVFLLQAPPHPR